MRRWLRPVAAAACLAACGPAAPTATDDAAPAARFVCEADPSEFQVIDQVALQDGSRMVTGCRHVTQAERERVINAIGPPLDEPMERGDVTLRQADEASTRVLLLWPVAGCDTAAEISVTVEADALSIGVTQRTQGQCSPGPGLTAIEVAFHDAVAVDNIATGFRHSP